ncbi:MAG: glutamine--fructose-6-phosphate transaminase (isomerizing), partial [Candidatus Latescibacteria bacterium]|nr:glutamine--fructose-6-phosphate transaminase (isomerizing) [Candidatus Latescibacterota bacterium]
MCGIFGYFGSRLAYPLLLNGLRRLEYRGYDSAGMAVLADGLHTVKAAGRVKNLEALLEASPLAGSAGIAHTRWATHGVPSEQNAHPHRDCSGQIALVHNGIVDNFKALKQLLESTGHTFASDTDTEVIAHLVEAFYEGDLEEAVRKALLEVEGTYGLAVLHAAERKIVAARKGSPLVLGIGQGEYFIASDPTAIAEHTKNVIYLDDFNVLTVDEEGYRATDLTKVPINHQIQQITWEVEEIERGDFAHFMLKEICEQPSRILDTCRGRMDASRGEVYLGGLREVSGRLAQTRRLIIASCGTSWHAGLVGEYLFESLAKIPVEVEYSTELICKEPMIGPEDTFIAVSQSGETADTLAALRLAASRGALTLGIVNVVGSSIARETGAGVYIHVGPEIGVASTKAFTGHLTALALMAVYLGRLRGTLEAERARQVLAGLERIPAQIESILERGEEIRQVARAYAQHANFLYLGRGINFPIALEGALKLKEVSYIHAEGIPAAEMKHGPISLVDETMPVLFVLSRGDETARVLGNMEEIRARKGRIVAIAPEGEERVAAYADQLI